MNAAPSVTLTVLHGMPDDSRFGDGRHTRPLNRCREASYIACKGDCGEVTMRAAVGSVAIGLAALCMLGCGASAKKSAAPKPQARQCSSYKGATRPQTCIPGTGLACSHYDSSARPDECFTPAQRRARVLEAKRKARLAKARARARAKARAAARAAAAARAKAHAAAVAAANVWHQGYNAQDDNVYWRWTDDGACAGYSNGCWHVEVITRYGCPSYVGVQANEYQGSSIIGDLLDNNGNGIPPKTPEVFELDADSSGPSADQLKAGDVKVTCD